MAADQRTRLNRDRVLRAAVALADRHGVEALSMRRLAQALDVVPMALYKHVQGKEELLDGVVEVLLTEIAPIPSGLDWRHAVRARVLAARRMLLNHPWARQVFESRTTKTPAVLAYLDEVAGLFRTGGFSDSLTHHVMHALGSRVWGFTQELFEAPAVPAGGEAESAGPDPAVLAAMAQAFPHLAAIVPTAAHEDGTVVGQGCDDQAEFEFALDLVLEGIARLRDVPWRPPASTG